MALLELQLHSDDIQVQPVQIDEDDDTSITSESALKSVFNGSAIISYDEEWGEDLEDMDFDVSDFDGNEFYEGYVKVTGAAWTFGDTDFEKYVCSLMNEQEIDGVFGILEGGIYSGYTELIYTAKAEELFKDFQKDIESFVADLTSDFGESVLVDKDGQFSIARLAIMTVEETIRRKVQSIIEY